MCHKWNGLLNDDEDERYTVSISIQNFLGDTSKGHAYVRIYKYTHGIWRASDVALLNSFQFSLHSIHFYSFVHSAYLLPEKSCIFNVDCNLLLDFELITSAQLGWFFFSSSLNRSFCSFNYVWILNERLLNAIDWLAEWITFRIHLLNSNETVVTRRRVRN